MLDLEEPKEQKNHYSWEPQAGPQTAFMHCPHFEILYGGARGGGKTDAAIGKLLQMALDHGKHYSAIFFRRELTQLASVIKRTKEIYPLHGAEYMEAKKEWHFPNGAVIYFRHLERDSDAEKYQGWSVCTLVFEEAGNFPDPAPINKLKGIVRSPHGVPCQVIFTANPGGPGHNWVKSRFIDPAPMGYEKITEVDEFTGQESHRMYIPSRVSDNAKLTENDPMYVARLAQTGSRELVKAWLDGDWDIVEGAFFDFSVARHVVRSTELPQHWLRFRSMDWGSAKPFAVYWWAVASEDWMSPCGKLVPRGAMIAYREWYGVEYKDTGELVPNRGLRMFAEDIGKGIAEREAKDHKISFGVIDPAAMTQDGGPSPGERISRGALLHKGRVFWRKADNKRVAGRGAAGGWDAMRARLDGYEFDAETQSSPPMLFFMDTCIHAIRTIPMMQHDKDNPEDIDTDAEDHAVDAIRYGVMARPWAKPGLPSKGPPPGLQHMTFDTIMEQMDNRRPTDTRIH